MKYALLLLLLVSATIVLADPEELDDRWVYYEETFERADIVYYVAESRDLRQMLLYIDNDLLILENGSCRDDIANQAQYCIEDMAWIERIEGENLERNEKHIKYEAGKELFGFNLVTYTLIPELKVTRSAKPSEAEVGEETTISVTLENEGEKPIEYIEYTELIPEALKPRAIDGMIRNGNFTYELNLLAPGREKIFQYRLEPQQYESISVEPHVTYVYDSQRKEADVGKLTLKVTDPLKISSKLGDTKLGVNEKTTYTLAIENEETYGIKYDVRVELPPGIETSDLFRFKEDGLLYTYSDLLSAGDEEELSFSLRTPVTGEYAFNVTVSADINGFLFSKEREVAFSTDTQKLAPRILFSQTDNKVFEGQAATISVYLENNEPDSSYINIEGIIESDFFTREVSSEVVVAGEEQLIEEFVITAPVVEERTNKELVFSGTYETRQGEELSFSRTLTIAVEPTADLFTVVHKPNTTTVQRGHAVKFAVEVTNDAGRYVFADIHDVLSPGVNVFSGNNFAEISFEENEQREVYLYELIVPEDFREDTLVITTRLQEEDSALTQEYTSSIAVTEGSINVVVPEEDVEEEITPEIQEEEESGFFSRVWNRIKSWFS